MAAGEGGPGRSEVGEAARSGGGEGVVDTAAAVDGLAARGEGAVGFEAVEDGVDDAFADGDDGSGAGADGLDDLVAVHLFVAEEGEDEEFGNAVHEARIGLARSHGGEQYIVVLGIGKRNFGSMWGGRGDRAVGSTGLEGWRVLPLNYVDTP